MRGAECRPSNEKERRGELCDMRTDGPGLATKEERLKQVGWDSLAEPGGNWGMTLRTPAIPGDAQGEGPVTWRTEAEAICWQVFM